MNTIIQTPTPNLTDSLSFYETLGFKKIANGVHPLMSDGQVLIEINPNHFARAGVKLFAEDWKDRANQIAGITEVIEIRNGYLVSDPSNTWIYLLEEAPPEDWALPPLSPSVLGKFAGLSLEVVAANLAYKIWKTLGFNHVTGNINQGWVTLTNEEGFSVSLMKPNCCPHLFFNPSLTYFNGGDNIAHIEKIRSLSIPITEEITQFNDEGIVDNIIIRDPGGLGCFVFND